MDPTPDDIADTLSASFRTMREMSDQFDKVIGTFLLIELLLALMVGAVTFYIVRKVLHGT